MGDRSGISFEFAILEERLARVRDASVRGQLLREAAETGALAELCALYEGAAGRAHGTAEAAALLHGAAEACVHGGRLAEAEALYRRILGMLPEDREAPRMLGTLYRQGSRWTDLASLLEGYVASLSPDDAAERAEVLEDLAVVYQEKLGQPYEAIAALEQAVEISGSLSLYRRLATAYELAHQRGKEAAALARVVDMARGTPEATAALRRMATVYADELELPERAIEAYTALVEQCPDDRSASMALEDLLQRTERWRDLAEALGRRIAAATDPDDKSATLEKLASILLDRLDAPDLAVACLVKARSMKPSDPGILLSTANALESAGRRPEAMQALEALLERGALTPTHRVELVVRLGQLRRDAGDLHGARRAAEEAALLAPDHLGGLTLLAELAQDLGDTRGFADARRAAAEVADSGARIDTLLEAAAALREADESDEAISTLLQLLELEPGHVSATWSLLQLLEESGRQADATSLLERYVAAEPPPRERARALTELAHRAGERAATHRRLIDALTVDPQYLPAIVGRAELLLEEGEVEQLVHFAVAARRRLDLEAADDAIVDLYFCQAQALVRLGREEEAFQVLLESDRRRRNDVRVRLALGEIAFRSRRWHEATRYLSPIADHPDAVLNASEVADGLFHAAEAENRCMHPDRARALYEAAVRLRPGHVPSLRALAQIDIDHGNIAQASERLERVAAATADPADRVRLYDALGDLAAAALGDPRRAVVYYRSAVEAATELPPDDLLVKLLGCQRELGDELGAAATLEALAAREGDASLRAARLCEAANICAARGEAVRARTLAARAAELDPLNASAVRCAVELTTAAGDDEAATSILARVLPAWERDDREVGAGGRRRERAQLWCLLAEVRQRRGDERGAAVAFRKVLSLDPDGPDALDVRRRLAQALAGEPSAVEALRDELWAVVQRDPRPQELLALARLVASDDPGACEVLLDLVGQLGGQLDTADRALLDRSRELAGSNSARQARLEPGDREAVVGDPDDGVLHDVFAVLGRHGSLLWPARSAALEMLGISDYERVKPGDDARGAALYRQIAELLGGEPIILYGDPSPLAPPVRVVCAAPPALVLGPQLTARQLDGDHHADERAMRFMIGRAVELLRPERLAAAGLPPGGFEELVGRLAQIDESVRSEVPPTVRAGIEALLRHASAADLDPIRYMKACMRAADRAGLIACGDVRVALEQAGGPTEAAHLVKFAVSRAYLGLRGRCDPPVDSV